MAPPRASVLLPVAAGTPWLGDTLASLSAQTLEAIEILALVDGSREATPPLVASWPDARLRIVPTGGVGIGAALQIGLGAARAPLVARQDADDLSAPDRLERQVSYLERYTHIDLVACTAEYIDGDGRPVVNDWVQTVRQQQDVAVTPEQIRDLMPLTCCITHGSIVARAGVLRAAGGYRDSTTPVEDYDLWLRLLPTRRLAKLPERLYSCRVHDAQGGMDTRDTHLRQTIALKLAYVRRLCAGLPAPARLAVVGRGVDLYCAVAPEQQFVPVPGLPALDPDRLPRLTRPALRRRSFDGWDVLAVTDVHAIDAYRAVFGTDREDSVLKRVGNLFVKSKYVAAEAAAA
jgi:hypothetical protein